MLRQARCVFSPVSGRLATPVRGRIQLSPTSIYARRLATNPNSPETLAPATPKSDNQKSEAALNEDYSPHENYVKPVQYTLSVFRKLVFYSSALTVSLATLAFLGFEGAHLWVENRSMTGLPKENEDDELWGWGNEWEGWTGGNKGGTDPVLSWRARHALRSAWMAQHWGTGSGYLAAASSTNPSPQGDLDLIEAFLAQTVELASSNPKLTFPPESPASSAAIDLLSLHASALERIGTRQSLAKARETYQLLWKESSGDAQRHVESARLAVKIGDLSSRLRQGDLAVDWWTKAIEYSTLSFPSSDQQVDPLSLIPQTLPPSPPSQRTLVSALVSLSAYYSMNGMLEKALQVEEKTLKLLYPAITSNAKEPHGQDASKLPGSRLHELFLQHRYSVLNAHLAEVLYGRSLDKSSKPKSSQPNVDGAYASHVHLHLAATSSEKVANALTSTPKNHGEGASPVAQPLASIYTSSPILLRPASTLLRNARRSAAESWNLAGLLYELEGRDEDKRKALECFERAVQWAGGNTSIEDVKSDVVEKEWEGYWKNYTRAKQRLTEKSGNHH
ncbi:hypothetical protein FRC02_000091 [Tulasnella sp. 418]|nr:hypothetical protein FRC02_000091 [Tulasnella sp. 418]